MNPEEVSNLYKSNICSILNTVTCSLTQYLTKNGEFLLKIAPFQLISISYFLRFHLQLKFEQLTDIIVNDTLKNNKRFEIYYFFFSPIYNQRLIVYTYTPSNTLMISLSTIYNGAN